MKYKKNKRAFSVVEALISAVVLTVAVVMIASIVTRSLISSARRIDYQTALDLARKQIAVIEHVGVNNLLGSNLLNGEVESRSINYNWQVKINQSTLDALYEVEVRVDWKRASQVKHIILETRLYDNQDTKDQAVDSL